MQPYIVVVFNIFCNNTTRFIKRKRVEGTGQQGYVRKKWAMPSTQDKLVRFLSVGLHVRTPASFRRVVALPPLPSSRTFVSIHYYKHFYVLVQGTFTP